MSAQNRYKAINKLAPAKAVALYCLNRYDDCLSFDEALACVTSTDFKKKQSRADSKQIDILKKLFEETFLPGCDPIDKDMFYNNYGNEVKDYFDDLVTFTMDMDLMFKLTLGVDETEADSLVFNTVKEFHARCLAEGIAHYAPSDEDADVYSEFNASSWLYSVLPLELLPESNFRDVFCYIDPLFNRMGCEFGEMDFDDNHQFMPDTATRKAFARDKLEYKKRYKLDSMDAIKAHIRSLIDVYPLSNGNNAFKKDFRAALAYKDDYSDPLAEVAEYIWDTFEYAKRLLGE